MHYDEREMRARGYDAATLAATAGAGGRRGWVAWRGRRAVVRTGLYLDELGAMFEQQRPDRCWRPEPYLANPDLSR
ncbi:MAG TPA: hypothetical protein VFZ91_16600 [Allosphingosinicella sp.]